jgi:membrane protein implicated in regulation of membrane protease activity
MEQNVGMTDRMIRIILGVVFIILALLGDSKYSLLWFIPAVIALVTGMVGWCGLYQVFGWNTNIAAKQANTTKPVKAVKKASKKKK